MKVHNYIFAIICPTISYFALYCMITPLYVGEFDTHTIFGTLKNIFPIAQIIGNIIGKFIGINTLHMINKQNCLKISIIIYTLITLSYVLFGIATPYGQIICVIVAGILSSLMWALIIIPVEACHFIEIIVASLYLAGIAAGGFAKTFGSIILDTNIDEKWMPGICASIFYLVSILPLILLNYVSDGITLSESKKRENFTKDEQWIYLKTYLPKTLPIILTYGASAGFRAFRDFYQQELLLDLIGPFDSSLYALTEIIVGVISILTYALFFFIKNDKKKFPLILISMLCGCLLVSISLLIYNFSYYSPIVLFILTGIGIYYAYIPSGALLYNNLMSITNTDKTCVTLIYISEFTSSCLILAILLIGRLFSYVLYFEFMGYALGILSLIALPLALFLFRKEII